MAKYNEKITTEICGYLENGMIQKDAAILGGIDEATFYRWKDKHASFASKVEASLVKYKQKLIMNVNINTPKDGKLALEVLARRWPEEFGVRIDIRGKVEHEHKITWHQIVALINQPPKRQTGGELDSGNKKPIKVRPKGITAA